MKTYNKREHRYLVDARRPAEKAPPPLPPENPFEKAAYEWNNALKIAAEKIWRK